MRLFDSQSGARCVRLLLASGALCLWLAACSPDGASRKAATGNSSSSVNTARGIAAPRTNLPMPPATTARDMNLAESRWTLLDGRRAGLADFRGQVVVLDFYATYCPPCRDEIPHLNALQRRFKNDGVNIIGLNVGGEADRLEVPKFVKELGIAYPLGNPDEPLVQTLFSDNDAIPQTYVFDRRGRLVQRFVGYDTTMPAELETAIQTALATTAD